MLSLRNTLKKAVRQKINVKKPVLPGIIISTLPKSGSVYLANYIARGLRIKNSPDHTFHGYFPNYYPIQAKIAEIAKGDILRQEHFDANALTLALLPRYTDRMVLHLRDPRQATLSWVHHAMQYAKDYPFVENSAVRQQNYTIHLQPNDIFQWSLERQIDWHIETHLVSACQWLNRWHEYLFETKNLPFQILVTDHEMLRQDEYALAQKILEYYEIDLSLFEGATIARTPEHHFRIGSKDEWRTVFTQKQKARCRDIIGLKLLEDFGWE